MQKFKERFDAVTSDTTYLTCIKKFYEVAEPKSYDELPQDMRAQIESSTTKLKEFCWELCVEAINRDFVSYVRNGDRGKVGQQVYDALKE